MYLSQNGIEIAAQDHCLFNLGNCQTLATRGQNDSPHGLPGLDPAMGLGGLA